jgi:hypothetical protein
MAVMKIFNAVPSTVYLIVFKYPVEIFGFFNTISYPLSVKPKGANKKPSCCKRYFGSLKDANRTYKIGYMQSSIRAHRKIILKLSKI